MSWDTVLLALGSLAALDGSALISWENTEKLLTQLSLSTDELKETVKDTAASRQTHMKTDRVQVDSEARIKDKKEKCQEDICTEKDKQACKQKQAQCFAMHSNNEMHPHRNELFSDAWVSVCVVVCWSILR